MGSGDVRDGEGAHREQDVVHGHRLGVAEVLLVRVRIRDRVRVRVRVRIRVRVRMTLRVRVRARVSVAEVLHRKVEVADLQHGRGHQYK